MRTETAGRAVYECRHCHERLKTSSGPWSGWRLCPRCGRAGLPPKQPPGFEAKHAPKTPPTAPGRDAFVTEPAANGAPVHALHVLVVVLLVALASMLSFIAHQGQLQLDIVILGLSALGLFGLLLYVGKKRRR